VKRFACWMGAFACATLAGGTPHLARGLPAWSGFSATAPRPAVVRVIVSEGDAMSLGSGTLVDVRGDYGLVLTNWHVVRDVRGPVTVAFADGFRSAATILSTNRDWDLAALAVWRPHVQPVRIADRAPQPGEPLTIAGYGSGRYREATGRCRQYVSPGGNHPFEMVELSASARQGDSGGPIFNQQGELAGVLFGAGGGSTTGSYCGRVRWFLATVNHRFDSLPATAPATMIAQPSPPRPAGNAAQWHTSRETPDKPTRRGGKELPVAAIAAGSGPETAAGRATPGRPNPRAPWRAAAEPAPKGVPLPTTTADESGAPPAPTPMLGGASRAEQLRNILAAIGLVAIVFHTLRILGAAPAGHGSRSAPKRRRA